MFKRYFFWTILAGLVGVLAVQGLFRSGRLLLNQLAVLDRPFTYLAATSLPATGKAISVDLTAMKISLYQNGDLKKTFPLVARGRAGTAWETPPGLYSVVSKSEKHFSRSGKIWLPYYLQFFDELAIHGWPTDEAGQPVAADSSGGCLRLTNNYAKEVYQFATPDIPVYVFNPETVREKIQRFVGLSTKNSNPLELSTPSYLAVDLDQNEILLAKNIYQARPIASLTKLMTALISLEEINQYQEILISTRAVATEGDSGKLKAGEKILAGNLLYPLLLDSSNDAAEVLAESYGRERFIAQMNRRAREIGLSAANFVDPSGLSPQNVASAADLYKLADYLYHTKPYVFKVPAELGRGFVSQEFYFLGGKNGFTDEAKQTAVSLWSVPFSPTENRRIAVVLLGSRNRQAETEKILLTLKKSTPAIPEKNQTQLAAFKMLNFEPETGPSKETTTLVFVGDIMLDRGVKNSVTKNAAGDYSWLFNNATLLAEADLSFGNLEGPISNRGRHSGSQYSFRLAPATADVLALAGFDVLSVANNHSGDWGLTAFRDTLRFLAAAGVATSGGGENAAAARAPQILVRNGIRFGFLAASDVGPNWLATDEASAGVVVAADKNWLEAITQAAAQVDVLIVSYHFGEEYQSTPTARQRELARLAIDRGAKIVVGHHPHVAQETESYRDGLIAYSLGNFIFDQNFSAETMNGKMLVVKIKDKKIADFKTQPVVLNSKFQPTIHEEN